tara:strand:+ start:1652 stop:2605 length:954 start_codon:yes stop_codon:yes gene_type:complete
MFKKIILPLILALYVSTTSLANDNELYQKLQDVSVTVKSGFAEGSGVIITREVNVGDNKISTINFVWTAGHVVDNLRSVRTVISNGKSQQIIEFRDAQIVKELVENGRRVGELKMDAKVIKYSDADNGEDLALLMIRKKGFIDKTIDFNLNENKPVPIGTELYHVGSLLGQTGSNSMTRGIMSQVGRVLNLGSGDGVVFDQTTVTAFPGSSGGGVFLTERTGENKGQYVGMLVRGAGETFNLIVPVRRMRTWAEENDILWAIDSDAEIPSLKDIVSLPIEGGASKEQDDEKSVTEDSVKFPVLFPANRLSDDKTEEK